MAGWSKRVNGSGIDCLSSLETPQEKLVDFIVGVKGYRKEVEGERTNAETAVLFTKLVAHLLEESHSPRCSIQMPPRIGNDKPVNLLKLYLVVRERGGYGAVSRSGLWDEVARECGFDLPSGVPLKLVYAQYLNALDRWLQKQLKEPKSPERNSGIDVDGISMDMDSSFMNVIRTILEVKTGKKNVNSADLENSNIVEPSVTVKTNVTVKQDDNWPATTFLKEENTISRKRKHESYLDMVNWVLTAAKDPCNTSIREIPDVSDWNSYGTDTIWKQALLLKGLMLLKQNTDSSCQNSVLQKSQKMHPTMYEDKSALSDRVRCSQRLVAQEDSFKKKRTQISSISSTASVPSADDPIDTQNTPTQDLDAGRWWNQHRRKRTPVGRNFQAEVPEWTGEIIESDSKWLGQQIWPLPKGEKREMLIERIPIGKGRQENCGCQNRGSYECVKFHISEKRTNLKYELGSAFYLWKLNCTGEDVATYWTKEEEKKFKDIVIAGSPISESKSFWDEIFKEFPKKSRDALISYHFNVFLLRRRAHQNRFTPTEIDSDDDEEHCGPRANSFGREPTKPSNPIFSSSKK
ncbi:unnamed protein product [Cuscuta epithymum]|uniref:ARID domain-containing protein n=1 Tax=Cuscuta epithymum TaxID=186058 RepID=A0AAV0DD66_9ASTE|nr:unnamed protein product [Cuscuta epithymum]